jgi:hypothetical protein
MRIMYRTPMFVRLQCPRVLAGRYIPGLDVHILYTLLPRLWIGSRYDGWFRGGLDVNYIFLMYLQHHEIPSNYISTQKRASFRILGLTMVEYWANLD